MQTLILRRTRDQSADVDRSLREGGVVGIWMAVTMMLLLGFVGLGLDSSYWYWQGWRQQQASDQASLAAAVFLPDRPAVAAAAAAESAAINGFANPEVSIGTGRKANEVSVGVRRTHQSFLMRLLGKTEQEIVRSSTAQYIAPLTLGSPYARLGNDPEDTSGTNLNFWLSQHGPWVPKHNGDRYAADNCIADTSVAHPTPFGCSAGTATRGLNVDYERLGQYGYRYAVDVTAPAAGKDLVFEVFDGVTTSVGNLCDPKDAPYSGKLPGPAERAALAAYVGDADVRYRPGTEPGGLAWCTSDHVNLGGDSSRNTQYMDTEFAVYSQARSVASGGTVQNTTPPTVPPPVPVTTIGPGGGNVVSAPCAQTLPSNATLNFRNTRATFLQVYWVNASCQETLITNINAGSAGTISSSSSHRFRLYDGVTGEFVSEYTVPANTNPSTARYARRSLEPAAFRNNYLSTSGGFSSQGVALTGATAHTWEVVPALNSVSGCNSFKSVDGSDQYLTFSSTGAAATLLPDNGTATGRNAASWCSGPGAAFTGSTTFLAYGQPNTYLWRNTSTNTVGAQTLAAAANGTLDWNVALPFAPQGGEPVPYGFSAELSMESGGLCLEPASTAENALLGQRSCGTLSMQDFRLQTNGRVTHTLSGRIVRPTGTNLQIGSSTGAASESWTPAVMPGGLLRITHSASSTELTNSCDPTPGRTLEHLSLQPATCTALRMRLREFVTPVLVAPGTQAPLVIDLVTHLNNPGSCSTGGAAATLTVNNPRSARVGVYVLESGCKERFLGDVAAGGTAAFPGLTTGARIRVYDAGTGYYPAADFTIASANQVADIALTGPATTCTTSTGAAATVNVTNARPAPIRVLWIDPSCNEITYGTISTGGSASYGSYAGHRFVILDTYTGKPLRSVTIVPGSQTIAEVPDTFTAGTCSTPSGAAATMTIVNQRTSGLELRRVEDDCKVVVDRTLGAGSTTAVTAWAGQRWKVFNLAGVVVQDILVTGNDTYTIVEPASWSGWDPNAGKDNGAVLICSRVETAYPLTDYASGDQRSGTISQLINPVDGIHDDGSGTRDPYAEAFTLGFRRWRKFCRIPAAQVATGRYTITVKTNLNNESAGNNSFSLRAVWVDSGGAPSETGLRLSAMENLPVFVNLGGSSTSNVYLTRLLPVHAGRTLRVELYDIGDTASGTVNVQILPPTDSGMTSWPCTMNLVSVDGTFAPPSSNAGTCAVTGLTRTEYNGTVTRFDIPIPDTFVCDPSIATNCWTKVQLSFSGGQPTDRTTWSATVLGDPLRLVK